MIEDPESQNMSMEHTYRLDNHTQKQIFETLCKLKRLPAFRWDGGTNMLCVLPGTMKLYCTDDDRLRSSRRLSQSDCGISDVQVWSIRMRGRSRELDMLPYRSIVEVPEAVFGMEEV